MGLKQKPSHRPPPSPVVDSPLFNLSTVWRVLAGPHSRAEERWTVVQLCHPTPQTDGFLGPVWALYYNLSLPSGENAFLFVCFLWSASSEDIFDLGSGIWFPGFKYHLPCKDFQLSKLALLPEWECLLSAGQQWGAGTACPPKLTVYPTELESLVQKHSQPHLMLQPPTSLWGLPWWGRLRMKATDILFRLRPLLPLPGMCFPPWTPFPVLRASSLFPGIPGCGLCLHYCLLITPLTLCSQLQHSTYHVIISFESFSH